MNSENVNNNHRGYLNLVAVITCMGAICFGFATSVVNGALDFMARPDQLNLNAWQQGVLSSGLTLGCAFGAVFGTPLSDKIGRKKELIWLGVIFTVFGLVCAFAPNAATIVICRFIMGLAVGAASSMVPVYLSEISPAATRGMYVSMGSMSIVLGQFIIFLVNSALGSTMGVHTASVWRWMLGVIAIPGILLWFGMYLAPESPQWYANHGNFGRALKSLYRVRSKAQAESEIGELKDNAKKRQEESKHKASIKDFGHGWVFQTLLTAALLGFFQQMSGINSIMYYGNKILVASGFGSQFAMWMNVLNGVFSVVGAVLTMFIIDKWGRKPLMLVGEGFCTIALVVIALVCSFALHASWTPWVVLIIMLLFIIIFQGTVGSVTWLYMSEVFPSRYRGLGTGIATFIDWLTAFLVALLFPQILAVVGMSSFYIFAAFCALGFWFDAVRLPETKGVPLDKIEGFFRKRYDKNYRK